MANIVAAALVVSLATVTIPPPTMGDPAALSADDRQAAAVALYQQGADLLAAGQAAQARLKYEEAYHHYAPDRHVFNYNIGWAAFEAGHCDDARAAFTRFIDMEPEHENRPEAQEQLLAIERGECRTTDAPEPAVPAPVAPTPPAAARPEDNFDRPDLESAASKRAAQHEQEYATILDKKKGGLFVGGVVATTVGGLGLIGGAISLGLANKRANELADLASPGPTGFPNGDYGNDETFDLDRNQLPANNAATIGLFAAGSVAAAVGVTLLVLDARKKKKGRAVDGNARGDSPDGSARRGRRLRIAASPIRRGAAATATFAF